MEPESLSAESAFPPAPPLLPPPVPPPVAPPRVIQERTSSLWRWNDRLALVVCGLTLFLLGVATGRVFEPDSPNDGNGGEPVAALSAVSETSEAANVISTEAGAFEGEVNPPELLIGTEPAEPEVNPEIATSAAAASALVSSETTANAATQQPVEQPSPGTASSVETANASLPPPPDVAPEASPVSLEGLKGNVLTIKPPAATQVCEPAKKFKDRQLSTALTWTESVQEAAQQAEEEEKLVFLIHVSGNFEMPGFT